jgi:hypothetical protein
LPFIDNRSSVVPFTIVQINLLHFPAKILSSASGIKALLSIVYADLQINPTVPPTVDLSARANMTWTSWTMCKLTT